MKWSMPIGLGLLVLGGWMIRVAPHGVFALGGLFFGLVGGFLLCFGAATLPAILADEEERRHWSNAHRIRQEHDLEVQRICREAGDAATPRWPRTVMR